jgi:hypothetical protein
MSQIVYELTETEGFGDGYEMREEDLKRLKGVHPMYKALRDALGPSIQMPILDGNLLRIGYLPAAGTSPYRLMDVWADLVATAAELKRNADRPDPLPHGVAIRKPELVGILKTASNVSTKHALKGYFEAERVRKEIPLLDAADFTEPEPPDELEMVDTFLVVGVRRDDKHGHRLFLTENDIPVVVPQNGDPKWCLKALTARLDGKTYLDGRLVRESKSEAWHIDPSADLVTENDLDDLAA